MSVAPPLIDASRCPLCGAANQCAMEVERVTGAQQPPCWCTQADFTGELLAQLPAEVRGQACICPACAGS
ncbi:MAG TPA: cysteine-rich CWC family protein [Ramlibacter sp.]|nr:cysteine-rich CWC family protein [Ramlibacter sp.]